jgi:hypothetical protein
MGITKLASDHLPVIAEFELQASLKADYDDEAEISAEKMNFLI